MSSNKVELEEVMELAQVIKYLEDLTECFRQGKIVVEKDGEFVTLVPPELVRVEVEAARKKSKDKFSLSLAWKHPEEAVTDPGLTIGTEEPPPPPEVEAMKGEAEEPSTE